MSSNIISMDGRIGPGTSVICGQNAYKYINDDWMNGMKAILDITINPDKIIVCRSSRQDQSGLILVKDEKNKNFYFGQTPRWDKQYCWFLIK
jgi:major membrane immunogen (membrane-anchored lipoprotein)